MRQLTSSAVMRIGFRTAMIAAFDYKAQRLEEGLVMDIEGVEFARGRSVQACARSRNKPVFVCSSQSAR